MKNFYIAGASSRSRTARVYIEYLNPDMKISAFLVSPEMTDNEPVVDGVPVVKISALRDQMSSSCPSQCSPQCSSQCPPQYPSNSEELSNQDSAQEMVDTLGEAEDKESKWNPLLDTSLPVYLGTRGVNHPKLEAELRAIGFTDIIPVDMQLDSDLRNAYLTKFYAENGREFVRMDMLAAGREKVGGAAPTARIYVASSIFDGKLEDEYSPLPEEHSIQVGCALTDKRLEGCDTFDNTGENISSLNKHFCELTGLYWIWKNAKEDYIGLVHYRRHFLLPDDWIDVCGENDIDVILPVPLYVNPSVAENYRERHIASDWDCLMEYFKKNLAGVQDGRIDGCAGDDVYAGDDEYGGQAVAESGVRGEYEDIVRILGGNLYSPCNMIIARREVLDELCSWMFPIIFAVYKHGEEMGIERTPYQSRYPGFISERLITYYFESRRDRYKVVYCNKNFLN